MTSRDHSDPDEGPSRTFAALAHGRRRRVLSCLCEHETVALADVADEIAIREWGMSITEIPEEAVSEIYMELYHRHVPTLEDADLVRYDQERDLVAISDRGKEVLARIGWR